MKQIVTVVLLTLVACSNTIDSLGPGEGAENGSSGSSGSGEISSGGSANLECSTQNTGKAYAGFDGKSLTADRTTKGLGVDRARIKPYPVLFGEFERVLGKMPQSVASNFFATGASFELPPPRWYEEPKSTGVGMASYFSLAFSAALAHVEATPGAYAALPTAESAGKLCTEMTHTAFRRRASADEVSKCVALSVTKLAKEKSISRRWAYTIASILSTADFLSY
jgi:hypothetical protein